ncbi:hypothetical protein [Pseudomonas sp. SG20052]|uniref:hypothetical protein n=1 Tax=Pseudomonas sp. SG20052 TaxID=3074147 RepID=UPI00287F8CCF|nr:hypothetical protein [Pseudomonas sp. SG20052]WNF54241.1 hypothetical protein RHP74_23365 [Pseudomonas sp. SG20052]
MSEQESPQILSLSAPLTMDSFAELEVQARVAGEGLEVEADNCLLLDKFEEAIALYRQIPNADRKVLEKLAYSMQLSNDKDSIHALGLDLADATGAGRVVQLRAIIDYSNSYYRNTSETQRFDRIDLIRRLIDHLAALPELTRRDVNVLAGAFHLALDRRRDTSDGSAAADEVCSTAMQVLRAKAPAWVDVLALCELLSDYRKYHDPAQKEKIADALSKLNIERSPILAPAFNAAARLKDKKSAIRALTELCRRYKDHEDLTPTVASAAVEFDDLSLIDTLPEGLGVAARAFPEVLLVAAINEGSGENAALALQALGKHLSFNLAQLRESYLSIFNLPYGPDTWPDPRHFLDMRFKEVLELLPPGELRARVYLSSAVGYDQDPSLDAYLLEAFHFEPSSMLLYNIWGSTVLDQLPKALIAKLVCENALEDEAVQPFEDEQQPRVLALNLEGCLQVELDKLEAVSQSQALAILREWGFFPNAANTTSPPRTSSVTFDFQRRIEGEGLPEPIRMHLAGLAAAMPDLSPADLIYVLASVGRLAQSNKDAVSLAASANTVELAYNQVLALAGQVLNEVGKDKVLKQTQRYGAPALLQELADWAKKPEAIADGEIIEQVSKRMVAKQGTLIPRRAYLAGILNKRLPNMKGAWLDRQVADCMKRGVDIEQMIELAKTVTSWGEWEQGIDSLRPY